MSEEKTRRARAVRLNAILQRENVEKRDRYAPRLVRSVNDCMGTSLNLADFCNIPGVAGVEWPSNLHDAPGLVAPSVDRESARRIMDCISNNIGPVDGVISFHEKDFLGGAAVRGVRVAGLLQLSAQTEDSVVLSLDAPRGVILVDCYLVGCSPEFSVAVQGDDLVARLHACFGSG